MKDQKSQATKPAAASAKATEPKEEGKVYTSFNHIERDRLRQLGLRERWFYLEIKGISNFFTGTVGNYKHQRLSYTSLAALLTVPGTQGRGQGGIDDTQAADFLKRFEAVGLVANIGRRANGGLRFDLPLSLIHLAKKAPFGENVGEMVDIFPNEVLPETPENPALTRTCDESDPSLSVMISKKRNIINDGAGPANAEPAPCRATGAAPVGNIGQGQAEASVPLTAEGIRNVLAGSWAFRDIDTVEAWRFYESWSVSGITTQNLHAAMTSLEESDGDQGLTPATLTPLLIPMEFDAWLDRRAA